MQIDSQSPISNRGHLGRNHPWYGFVSERTQTAELEPLQRTLRYAGIDLEKFWVELQSIPIFMKSLSKTGLSEIERMFQWVLASAGLSESIDAPHLIPAMADPEQRKLVMDFVRDVITVQMRREEVLSRLNRPPVAHGTGRLSDLNPAALDEPVREAANLVATTPGLSSRAMRDLTQDIRVESARLDQLRMVIEFFERLANEAGLPRPACGEEAIRVLNAIEGLSKMPPAVYAWRTSKVIEPGLKVKIEAWQNRARPIVELRQRLTEHFNLAIEPPTSQLRDLAETLKKDSILSAFDSLHRQARKAYQALLLDKKALKRAKRENGHQAAARLLDWIKFREQTQSFELQAEARALFGAGFAGIDTDFASALATHLWAERARDEVAYAGSSLRDDTFGPALFAYLQSIDPDRIESVVSFATQPADEFVAIRRALGLVEPSTADGERLAGPIAPETPLARLEGESKARLEHLVRLKELLYKVLPREELPLSELSVLDNLLGEIRSLGAKMDANAPLRAALGAVYQGPDTDLSTIDRAAGYVKQIRAARLEESVTQGLLSTHGPSRLIDARNLVGPCLISLATVREHYVKLENATHGAVRVLNGGFSLDSIPVREFGDRLQAALKQKQLLEDAMQQLRYAALERSVGLTPTNLRN